MKDFQNKIVVITGGATGIGFSFAKQFGSRGAKLAIAGRRKNRLSEAVEKLIELGTEAVGFECDVTKRQEVEALADFAWDTYGRVDVILNNAGVGPKISTVIETKREDIQKLYDVNIFGVWNGISVFGKRFLSQGIPAAIYNVGSENSFFDGVPHAAAYVSSKHAVLAITDALRKEVPDFIDVGLICPGFVRSELAEDMSAGMDTDEYTAIAMKQIEAGEFFIVSHSYNMMRINERYQEISKAYAKYAPRYEGDDEFDVRTLLDNLNQE